ncbi:MAG: DNA polymerase I, partial [Dehalococcoidia bacterium]|nr:DNA polymerase I [Dehalococcoidia bacterium]
VHRAWHAIQNPLTNRRTGEDVRGVYGFIQMFMKAVQDYKPAYLAITFDTHAPTFRHIAFEAYKAQRPAMPDDLRKQFPLVHGIMEAFKIPVFEVDGFEADDLMGTLSLQAEQHGLDALVVTGDTDVLQLISPHTRVLMYSGFTTQAVYNDLMFREKYGGLVPSQLVTYKALLGDTSDNVPGVPGIGKVAATKLLLAYHDVEGIYANLSKLPPKQQELFKQHRDTLRQGIELITIHRDAPVALNVDLAKWPQYERKDVVERLRELEFLSLVDRIPEGLPSTNADGTPQPTVFQPRTNAIPRDYQCVSTMEALEALKVELATHPFALDTETTSTDPMRAKLVGLSFATAPGKAWYVPVGHSSGAQLSARLVLDVLKPVLEDGKVSKAAHNANYDMSVLANEGVFVQGLDMDTMLAAYMLGHKAIGLKQMALAILGEEMTPIASLIGTGRNEKTMDLVSIADTVPYAAADADMTLRLRAVLEPELKALAAAYHLFTTVEMPLLPIVVQMQRDGIALDTAQLEAMSLTMGDELARLERSVYEAVGHQFNMGSPKQLGDVLFDELHLPKTKRTASGGYTTDASALDNLRETLGRGETNADPRGLQVIEGLLKWRGFSKLKSTYVDSLPTTVNPRTRRIHTTYNLAGSVTGRIASSEPNLQNIPIRTEAGRRIRRAFVPREPGWILLGADYSQIELRVLAHLSQDPSLLEAFHQGLDIHSATASQVFNVPLKEVSSDQRRIAKVLNFGVIYGLSAYGIAQQTELSPEQGRAFISSYFGKYPLVLEYIERTKKMARDKGYVETMLGRRRQMPEALSTNRVAREAAEREAINMPVQGTAAEIMKLAMIRVAAQLKHERVKSRMLLQVHDELIFETPAEEVSLLRAMLMETMPKALEGIAPFTVPLDVAVKTGASWGELE